MPEEQSMGIFDADRDLDLGEWGRRREAVARRVDAYPEQYRVGLADKPPGTKAWDHRGVFEIVSHRVHPEARSFAGYPLVASTLRHEGGEEGEVIAAEMSLVPNWQEGTLVWDHGTWKLYRLRWAHNVQESRLVWVVDVETGETDRIYPAEAVQPWTGTVEEFLKKYRRL